MFGGFAPMPLRLGGTPEDGVSAQQWARLTADALAVRRVAATARITVDIDNQTASQSGRSDGNGPGGAPTVAKTGTGVATVTWPTTIEDEFEAVESLKIDQAKVTAQGTIGTYATCVITAPNVVTVYGWNAAGNPADIVIALTVWGTTVWPKAREIGDYGGALDKTDDVNESTQTYAWTAYQDLTSSLGTAYTTETSTHVHARKLALARCIGAVARTHEKVAANSVPNTADEKLESWAQVLGVPFSADDPAWLVRNDCGAKFSQVRGSHPSAIEQALDRLLGNRFIELHRTASTNLSDSLPQTYWPTVNPGATEHDLGPGTWRSERSHVWVEVTKPPTITDPSFHTMVNVKLPRLMNATLPVWSTFNWASSVGFQLDVSLLDFDSLTD